MQRISSTLCWLAGMDLVWRHIFNRRASREYRSYVPKLGAEGARILSELNEQGYAITHTDRFAGAPAMFEELRQQALKIESIAARRRFAAPGSRQGGAPGTGSNLLGSYPLFDREGVFARFATQFELLEIVNAYFGMFAQLRDYAVFKTSALLDGVNSRWHRDAPYNAPVVRLFVYFAAVATENGAFLYAPGTHSKSRRGSREVIGDEVLERIAVPCVGPAGTIVFADTRGYHRASNFVSGERWSYNCGFTSPGFGADFLTRRGVERPRSLDPKSWALASPLRLRDNFFYRAD